MEAADANFEVKAGTDTLTLVATGTVAVDGTDAKVYYITLAAPLTATQYDKVFN